ncbi:hypothetical protein [Mycobacterium sp. Aquia_213]|uniref:hypothetical protein n=1 Tax=Mycobacterium sp. Aquia_213 TaxID=2991728 RepID=UPI0022714A6F|nr:hypothetical protein [Mycobacterium sp. Aquia_213]WAC93043.1 hypothetical protein LMQ14_07875 [Mycobacterium sp. Aquia_213]
MKSTAKAVVHRLKQARSAVLKVEATLAGAQFLLALGPVGVLIALVLWARRRRAQDDEPARGAAEATPPAATTSANAAANGHAR